MMIRLTTDKHDAAPLSGRRSLRFRLIGVLYFWIVFTLAASVLANRARAEDTDRLSACLASADAVASSVEPDDRGNPTQDRGAPVAKEGGTETGDKPNGAVSLARFRSKPTIQEASGSAFQACFEQE